MYTQIHINIHTHAHIHIYAYMHAYTNTNIGYTKRGHYHITAATAIKHTYKNSPDTYREEPELTLEKHSDSDSEH
jgi:hypothetical protein